MFSLIPKMQEKQLTIHNTRETQVTHNHYCGKSSEQHLALSRITSPSRDTMH